MAAATRNSAGAGTGTRSVILVEIVATEKPPATMRTRVAKSAISDMAIRAPTRLPGSPGAILSLERVEVDNQRRRSREWGMRLLRAVAPLLAVVFLASASQEALAAKSPPRSIDYSTPGFKGIKKVPRTGPAPAPPSLSIGTGINPDV